MDYTKYYNNLKEIIIIQKFYRIHIQLKKFNNNYLNYNNQIISQIIKHNEEHNKLFIKCKKIYRTYSPSKNENKFIFGNLIQLSVIDFFNQIFIKCIDLDDTHNYGSEYKDDCILYLTSNVKFNLSIKCKSKKQGDIILINKHHNNINHLKKLINLITIVIIVESNDIIIIFHNLIDNKYIKEGPFGYLKKQQSCFFKLQSNP
jgi:hypothetical protein